MSDAVAASYAAEAVREVKRSRVLMEDRLELVERRIDAVEREIASLRTELNDAVKMILAAIKPS